MKIKPEELKKKGWSEHEIKHATKALEKTKKYRHAHHNLLNETLFWAILALSIFAIAALTYWVTPIFIYAKNTYLLPILFIIGISFGLIFQVIIKDLENLQVHHHTSILVLVPITGIISGVAIFGSITQPEIIGGIKHNPYVASIVFSASFLLPYIYHLVQKK